MSSFANPVQVDPLCLEPEEGLLGSISDADLFKYFLNEDIASVNFQTDLVESDASSPQTSPQLTPDSNPHSMDSSPTNSIALSREDLLKISTSKGMESYSQTVPMIKQAPAPHDDDRQVKRQRRLIKNRESAQLSRLRKKIYIEELERKVSHLTAQNETLTRQVQAITVDKKKLADEVLYLQNIIKQSPQLAAIASNGGGAKKPHVPRNVKAAGVCLLIVLFSFGLLFNANSGLPFATSNRREDMESSSRGYSGRTLKDKAEIVPVPVLSNGKDLQESSSNQEKVEKIKVGQKIKREEDQHKADKGPGEITKEEPSSPKQLDPKRKRMKISEDEHQPKDKSLVPFSSSQVESKFNNTSYIYCPQAQQLTPSSSSANRTPGEFPEVVALLIPSSFLNGTLLPNNQQAQVDSSLLEISCHVLSLNVWPMPNLTNNEN